MVVKFKNNTEPCIVYNVIEDKPVIEFDEVLAKYCECIRVEAIGLVPKELFTPITGHKENINAIDILLELNNEP